MVRLLEKVFFYGVTAGVLTLGAGARAQTSKLRAPLAPLIASPASTSSFVNELRTMAGQAGTIFAGRVMSVRPQPNASGSLAGWVEIDFQVEEAVRGCRGQDTYVLREWAGLWTPGLQRYTVGQRFLMVLHAPGLSGMSSPVGDQDGAIPITGGAPAVDKKASSSTTGDQVVDVRWLEARLPRPLLTGPQRYSVESKAVESKADEAISAASSRAVSLGSVLTMLGSWESRQTDATR